jgi:uncharacterized protein
MKDEGASAMRLLGFVLLLCMCGLNAKALDPQALVNAARKQIGVTLWYDAAYVTLDYPGGDVAIERGVCTDVVIRAYRELGVDLQVLVHQDISAAWKLYPKLWGLKRPDRNIDHRRVPNLATYFRRFGKALRVTDEEANYLPGDIVTWVVSGNRPHIGIVSDKTSLFGTPLVIHNLGLGVVENNILFDFPITGHYRFRPKTKPTHSGSKSNGQ